MHFAFTFHIHCTCTYRHIYCQHLRLTSLLSFHLFLPFQGSITLICSYFFLNYFHYYFFTGINFEVDIPSSQEDSTHCLDFVFSLFYVWILYLTFTYIVHVPPVDTCYHLLNFKIVIIISPTISNFLIILIFLIFQWAQF